MTPIAVEIISQNFQELLNFAGNIPLLTEKFEYFFQLNSWKSTQVNSIECCKTLCLITDVQVFFFF